MSAARPALSRTFIEWLMVTALCAGMAAAMTAQDWLWRLDGVFYDAAMVSRQRAADPDVVIVAIDDRSLSEIGRWPWDRAVHAALLERLTELGASVVAMDVMFHEPAADKPAGDAALAAAIERHGRVVLPVTHATYAARSDGEARPAPVFAKAAAALGHIHIELDPDGIARSIYLWEGMNAPRFPQLSLAALALGMPSLAAPYTAPPVEPRPGWRRADWMRVPFAGPPGTYRYVSYVDVLRGEVPEALLRNAIVFVGATAVGMGDIVPTPTSGHMRPMPGVELHATVFSALRRGDAIRSAAGGVDSLLAGLLVAGLMLVMLRSGPRFALLAAFGFAGLALGGASYALVAANLWLPPAGAVLACMFAYPLWSWRRLEATQHYLDTELTALRETSEHFALILPAMDDAPVPDRFRARIAMVRAAARRQRTLQRFIADTLDGLPVGAVVMDPEGQIRLVNRRATELLGVSEPWAVRATLAAMAWPHATRAAELPRPDDADGPLQVEAELADGRVVLASAAGLFDDNGQSLGAVIGLSDISALRAAQRSREDTMHFLSHDLRAPLASILTMLDPANAGAGAPVIADAERLGWVERYVRKALTLADDLFRLVRAEDVDPARFTALSLEMVVHDAVDQVWAIAHGKHIRLVTEIDEADDDQPCLVRGDGDLLCRAIVNLLGNAVKYTPEGGEVRVSLTGQAGEWAVAVSDTGAGIAPELQSRLFQRFARLPTAQNRRIGGVGLGLMMVRTVAERHGGSVSVSSRGGEGSVFTLRLPAA